MFCRVSGGQSVILSEGLETLWPQAARGLRGSAATRHLRNLKLVRMLLDPVSLSHALSRECNALRTPAQ